MQGVFKLMEAKYIGDKSAFGRYEYRLNPSCDPRIGSLNETIRHIQLVPRRSIGGHHDHPKSIAIHSDKRVGW